MPLRAAALLFLLPVLLTACYQYTPTPVESVRPGATVRAHVDEPAARDLAWLAGSTEPVPVVEGEVRGRGEDHLVLWWTVGAREVGARRQELGQEVRLTSGQLRAVETRELDRVRTGMVAGAAGIGLGVLVVQLFGDTGRSPDGRPPGPEEIRIPLSWR